MATAQRTDLPMTYWGPGVTHWECSDGKFFAVMVDDSGEFDGMSRLLTAALAEVAGYTEDEINTQTHVVMARPTTLVRCDENGHPIDADTSTPAVELLTEYEFPAGTSDADAMVLAGYAIESEE